jgi:hypothetical protein
MNTVNISLFKTVYAENQAVKAICDHLAGRSKNQYETKLHRIIHHLDFEGYEFKHAEVIAALRKLEEVNLGKFVEGRRGWLSRFVWNVGSLNVAALATDGESALIDLDMEDEFLTECDDLIEHTFVLRPDLSVTFELPSNLSAQEADRLSAFLQSLPFGEQ